MINMASLLQQLPWNVEPGKIVSPMMHMKHAFRNEAQDPTEPPMPDDDLRRRAEKAFGVDLQGVDMDEFRKGLEVEREHDDVTNGDWTMIAKIALAHLRELPDYYTRLAKMEKSKNEDRLPIIRKALRTEDDHVPSYMNRSSLEALKANAEYLLSVITDETPVDNWAEDHIATAAHDLSQVADYMRGRGNSTDTPKNEAFKSKAQQKYFFAKAGDKDASAKNRAEWKKRAKEFSDKTDFDSLPDKKTS